MKRKIYLRLQAYDKKDIVSFEKGLFSLLKKYELTDLKNYKILNVIEDNSSINLPMTKKKVTVLRSPHANKKAKDQFEIRLYNKLYYMTINCSASQKEQVGCFEELKTYCGSVKKVSLKITCED